MQRAVILALNEGEKNSIQVLQSLEVAGHRVILSGNYQNAIAVLHREHVDMIISDVHLENGGNVFDFLRWVKKNPATRETAFVLFSNEPTSAAKYFEDGVRTSARLLGAAMYISMHMFNSCEFRNQIDALLPEDKRSGQLTIKTNGE